MVTSKHCCFWMAVVLAGELALGGGCGSDDRDPTSSYNFSFENDLEGWSVQAIDHTHSIADSTWEIPWHIEPTTARASSGSVALEYYFHNTTDAAKIWIERPFKLQAGHLYDYDLSFDFWAVGGVLDGNPLLAALLTAPARARDDVVATRIGGAAGAGVDRWVTRGARGTVAADSTGVVYAMVGVWGTFEIAYTYWLDNLHLVLRDRTRGPRQPLAPSVSPPAPG